MGRRLLRVSSLLAGLVAITLATAPTWAQDYQVRAYIQPDQAITETQTVRLVIQVEGVGNPNLVAPRLSELTNLDVVSGPDRRFDSVWRNGRFSSTSQFVYTLLPKGPGAAVVPGLQLEIEGQVYRTEPIEFQVAQATGGAPPPRSSAGRGRGGSQNSADVFIRAALGSDDVWVGQAVPLTVSVYTAERISNPNLADQPSLSRFWVEDVEVDPDAESFQTTLEGRRYVVYPMVRKILVPQTSGEIEIDPWVMQIPVNRRSTGEPFEFFSIGRTQTVVRKTQPLKLRVRPLPTRDRPQGFSGAVGSFSLKVAVDRTDTAVNEAISLKATVEGEGFLRAVTPPLLDVPPELKLFDPKISSTSRNVRGKLVSRKTWEWALVPLAPGELKVPDLSFTYFDPASGEYASARGGSQILVVRRGEQDVAGPLARTDIQLKRRDLAYVKPLRTELRQRSVRVHETALFVTLAALPLAWVPLVSLVGRRRVRLQRNRGLVRARRARSKARKRFDGVTRGLSAQDSAGFHEEIARGLVEYVADRFDRSAAGMTYEEADRLLADRGIDADVREQFRTCLETCDFARFVPASDAPERRTEVLERARDLVDRIERAW